MKVFRRSLLLATLAAAFLSSCSTLCCNKTSARIEADIAMATEKKEDVEAAQKDAYKRIARAKEIHLSSDFPEKFDAAMELFRPADLAYDNVKYATARRLYLEVSEILSNDFMTKALECRDERAKVESAMKAALEACADSLCPQRFKDAQDLYIKALALKAADDLPNALAACRKAVAAFDYAAEYARTIKLRDSIGDCQALKDYSKEYLRAEGKLLEDEALWKHGTVKDYALGMSILNEAGRQYSWIAEQCRKLKEEQRLEAERMRLAAEKLAAEKAAADGALACAKDGLAWADANGLVIDYEGDYSKAKARLAEAETASAAGDYIGAAASAAQVCELFSDQYRTTVLAERARIAAEKAAAEKLAAEKAAADGALACAKDGLAWADANSLSVDYADDYTKAKARLAEAETANAAGDYVGAAASAAQVCELFSDQYRTAVLAERARIAAEKAEPVKPIVKASPDFFSPDDDGLDDVMSFNTVVSKDTEVKSWVLEVFEEYIVDPSTRTYSVAKRSFKTWTGNGTPPDKIAWNGKSDKEELVQSGTTYPYVFTYTDKLNRTTSTQGAVIVGIIAQKTGDTISIKLPSLVFRADKSDFLDLDPHVVERNNLLIAKLAESLRKYSDYNITVEGHANNIGKMVGYPQPRIEEEEKQQVLPLSTGRAEKLKAMLIEQGIDMSLISVIGYGSSKPVVSFTDVVNRWKNRRVEFTLIKKNAL